MAEILRNRDTRRTVSGIVLPILVAVMAAGEVQVERRLEAAVHREIVLGDLNGAIAEYKAILSHRSNERAVAARALYQMGQCLEKLGRRAEARSNYARVVDEYGDQTDAARPSRARLADWGGSIPGPMNLRFDQGAAGRLPAGWFVPALPQEADQWAQLRRMGCMNGGSCAVVMAPADAPVHVSNLMQRFSAAAYRGKTVRLRAWIRVEAVAPGDQAQMWLGVERGSGLKGFADNMADRPVRSPEWTECEIRGWVDEDATFIKFGVTSVGKGRVWVDSVSFETLAGRP